MCLLVLVSGCAQPKAAPAATTAPPPATTKYFGGPDRIQTRPADGECGPISVDVQKRNPVEHRNDSGYTRIARLATLTNYDYGGAPHFDVDCQTLRVEVRTTWDPSFVKQVNITLRGCDFFEGAEGATPLTFTLLDDQVRGDASCRPLIRPLNNEPIMPPTTFSWNAQVATVRDFSGG